MPTKITWRCAVMSDFDRGEAAGGPALCRDCLAFSVMPGRRCPACGHARLVRHPELADLSIAHIDCDAFYAAIEKRDDPSLRDRPVIIGGGRRGVVATACYVARISGVRSAMPMFKALKACPDAVVMPPDMVKYARVARQIREMMLALTPLVEPLSIDEAFLDLSGTERLHRGTPAETLARFAARVEREIGITVSVGLSHNKFLAKIASDLDKPRGFSVIGRAETRDFLAGRPVGLIWGVGRAMQERLARDGLYRIGQLQGMGFDELGRRYGVNGIRLGELARGIDKRPVRPDSPARSISAETTFEVDSGDGEELRRILRHLCEKVSARLKARRLAGRTVTLKLKTADFRLRTRSRRLADPTQLADRMFRTLADLLDGEVDGYTMFRLIGAGISDFEDAAQADPDDLVDETAQRRAAAEHAMDAVRRKFGTDAVRLGIAAGKPGARIDRPAKAAGTPATGAGRREHRGKGRSKKRK